MKDEIADEVIARWAGRGGIIRFEPCDGNDLVGHVPIDRLLEITNPVSDPPWHDGSDVAIAGVMEAIREQRYEKRPYSSDLLSICRREWNSRRHEERIAWLVLHPPSEPIEVEIDQHAGVGIDDGMHRLYAAVVRNEGTLAIRIGGFLDYAPEAIGVLCDLGSITFEADEDAKPDLQFGG